VIFYRPVYFVEETDMLAINNSKRIQTILDNPKNYSLEYIFNLEKKELHGVSKELRKKLANLLAKK